MRPTTKSLIRKLYGRVVLPNRYGTSRAIAGFASLCPSAIFTHTSFTLVSHSFWTNVSSMTMEQFEPVLITNNVGIKNLRYLSMTRAELLRADKKQKTANRDIVLSVAHGWLWNNHARNVPCELFFKLNDINNSLALELLRHRFRF